METKICGGIKYPGCGKELPLDKFGSNKTTGKKIRLCKDCVAKKAREDKLSASRMNWKPPKKEKKEKICSKCKKKFLTEVDDMGVAYTTRCPRCKTSEKNSDSLGNGIFGGKVVY